MVNECKTCEYCLFVQISYLDIHIERTLLFLFNGLYRGYIKRKLVNSAVSELKYKIVLVVLIWC